MTTFKRDARRELDDWLALMERKRRFMNRYRWLYWLHERFERQCSRYVGRVWGSRDPGTPLREWLFRFCGDTEFFLRKSIKLVMSERP